MTRIGVALPNIQSFPPPPHPPLSLALAAAAPTAAAVADASRIPALQQEVAKLHAQLTTTREATAIPAEHRDAAVAALLSVLTTRQGELAAAQAVASTALAPSVVPASAPARLAATLASLNANLLGALSGGGAGGASTMLGGMGLGGGGGAAGVGLGPGGISLATRVYVGSLQYDIGEPDLRAMFSPFGRIAKIDVSFEPATGRTKGYAFVSYETVESADRAIAAMNGQMVAGRPIKVGKPQAVGGSSGGGSSSAPPPSALSSGSGFRSDLSLSSAADAAVAAARASAAGVAGATAAGMKPSYRVYVGAVPYEITGEHLKAIFGPFGNIRSVTLLPSTEPGGAAHRGYGFIEFDNEASGKAAIDAMNGFEIGGRRLKVNLATSAHAPGGGGGGGAGPMGLFGSGGGGVGMGPQSVGRALGGGGGGAGMMQQQQPGQSAPSGGMLAAFGLGGGGFGYNAPPPQQQQAYGAPLQHQAMMIQQQPPPPQQQWGGFHHPPLPTQQHQPPPPPPSNAPMPGQVMHMQQQQQQQQFDPYRGGVHMMNGGGAPEAAYRVVALNNMVDSRELAGDPELESEIKEECSKHGRVLEVRIVDHREPSGRVTIFVLFEDPRGAAAAVASLDRRFFGGRVTSAVLAPESAFFSAGGR